MIGADQASTVWEIDGNTVAEFWARFRNDTATPTVRRKKGIERDFSQGDDDFECGKQLYFVDQVGTAAKKFG